MAKFAPVILPWPPVIKTRPSTSTVAVCKNRLEVMSPAARNVPDDCACAIEKGPEASTGKRKTTLIFIS
jgi:hypothetical protein